MIQSASLDALMPSSGAQDTLSKSPALSPCPEKTGPARNNAASPTPGSRSFTAGANEASPSIAANSTQHTSPVGQACLQIISGVILALYCIAKACLLRLIAGKIFKSSKYFAKHGSRASAFRAVTEVISNTVQIVAEDWNRAIEKAKQEDKEAMAGT